ncbi:MAG: ABC transporter permease [Mariprofundaceae bacterium]|nr:ABC transporter permease [Mariprofundaceae bacterium]
MSFIQRCHERADYVGAWVLNQGIGIWRFLQLLLWTSRAFIRFQWLARIAVTNVVIRQLYFTGVQSLIWIIVMALCIGALTVYNIAVFARSVQDLSLIGRLINTLLVQEIAPVVVVLFLLVRSGVAVVTEIGHMQARGEDIFLHSLGISLFEYIYLPRALAFAISGVILTFIFVVVSIWFGGLFLSWMYVLNFSEFLVEVQRGTEFTEVVSMFLKGLFYPLLSCMVLIDQGRCVGLDPNQIPVRVSSAVMGVMMMVIILDAIGLLL